VLKIKTARRRLVQLGGIAAGLAAVAGLAVGGVAAASTNSPVAPHGTSGPKPTIVLVHGAWANGSSWNGVVQRLQADGYTVDVPPNPLLGLTYDPEFIADFLHSITGPIVLVGHSYGGAVITNAATGDAQVKALVYVDAFAPDQGQTVGQLVSSSPGSCVLATDPTTIFNLATYPGAPAWKTIPSWAVVGTADHVIPPAVQLAMARHAHAHITEVKAPHLSMIAAPGVVTQVILKAVHATG
jgi:pimeloyl-ACP methyl ester carboxylesterase